MASNAAEDDGVSKWEQMEVEGYEVLQRPIMQAAAKDDVAEGQSSDKSPVAKRVAMDEVSTSEAAAIKSEEVANMEGDEDDSEDEDYNEWAMERSDDDSLSCVNCAQVTGFLRGTAG